MPRKIKNIDIRIHENDLPDTGVVYEKFSVMIDDINPNLPSFNGSLWMLCGQGGSGKSSLFLSLFKSKKFLKGKFDEIHYIVKKSSYQSVKQNPFDIHDIDKVHHELSPDLLYDIFDDCIERRDESINNNKPIEHTCLIIDDFGSALKDPEIEHTLKTIMNTVRHANLYVIFICQTYLQMPKELRRILTHLTVFKPNPEEWSLIVAEMMLVKKDVADRIYNYVFDQMYNHLTINKKGNELRKNFKLLEITT